MYFIHCFDVNLKNELLQKGFKLLFENNGLCIFENNHNINFNFKEVDKSQFVFTNNMFF